MGEVMIHLMNKFSTDKSFTKNKSWLSYPAKSS